MDDNINKADHFLNKKEKSLAPVKGRLKEYLKVKKITATTFCEAVGIGTPVLRQIYNELTTATVSRIFQIYTDLSPDWLMWGEGNMLRGDNSLIQSNEKEFLLPMSEIKRMANEAQNSLRIVQTAHAQLLEEKDKQLKEKNRRINELQAEIKKKDEIIKHYLEKKM